MRGNTLSLSFDNLIDALTVQDNPYKMGLNKGWDLTWQRFGPRVQENWINTDIPKELEYIYDFHGSGFEGFFKLSTLGTTIYKGNFSLPPKWEDRETFLVPGVINSYFNVYINSLLVDTKKSMGNINITPYVNPSDNTIEIEILPKFLELSQDDALFFNGIFGEVYLHSQPKTFIKELHTQNTSSLFGFDVAVQNCYPTPNVVQLNIYLFDSQNSKSINIFSHKLFIQGLKTENIRGNIPLNKLDLAKNISRRKVILILKELNGNTIEVKTGDFLERINTLHK